VGGETLLGELLVLRAWLAIVGVRPDADAATRGKDTCYLDVLRVHQLDEVLHDDVHAVFMEVAMVAKTEQIELEALAFHHLHVGDVADANLGEVWLSRNRAERCKLWAVETNPVIVARVLVDEGLQDFWRIIHFVLGLGSESLQPIFFSIHCF